RPHAPAGGGGPGPAPGRRPPRRGVLLAAVGGDAPLLFGGRRRRGCAPADRGPTTTPPPGKAGGRAGAVAEATTHGRGPDRPVAAPGTRGSRAVPRGHRRHPRPVPVTSPRPRGVLDTSTVLGLPLLRDPALLPDEQLIAAVTLAELSVGPLVATSDQERARRLLQVQQAENDFEVLALHA